MAADVDEGSGGVASHVSALVHALRAAGHRVDTLWAGDVPRSLPGPLRTVGFSLALGRRARRLRPDVLHAHTSTGSVAHLLAPATTTCVTTSHGDERALWRVERQWWREGRHQLKPWSHVLVPGVRLPLFRAAVRAADGVVALHDAEAQTYRRWRGGRATVAVVPNAARGAGAAGTPVPGRVVYVGTWIWRKGSTTLVEAFTRAHRQDPSLTLHLVGPDAAAREDFPPEVRPAVRACGFLSPEGVDEELRQADVLVLPSLFEGMPLVALDALAYGVPVVATDLPGTRAAVGDAGVLVPVGDAAAVADALARVTADRVLRHARSRTALALSAGRTWETVGAQTQALYAQADAVRPRGPLGRLPRLLPARG